jgi:Tfp pilus assembly protein PilN
MSKLKIVNIITIILALLAIFAIGYNLRLEIAIQKAQIHQLQQENKQMVEYMKGLHILTEYRRLHESK